MMELFARAEEKTPYVLVALQECERMNGLTREMKRSLKEVDLGLKVLLVYSILYHIARKFGRELNLAVWRSISQPPN